MSNKDIYRENMNNHFETLAELFYEETGYMAPGKDVASEMSSEQYDRERRAKWREWIDKRNNK